MCLQISHFEVSRHSLPPGRAAATVGESIPTCGKLGALVFQIIAKFFHTMLLGKKIKMKIKAKITSSNDVVILIHVYSRWSDLYLVCD